MAMRKYIRAMLRGKAEKFGAKPSKYVNSEFDRIQIKKYGVDNREINKAKGTHPKKRWKARVEFGKEIARERKDIAHKQGVTL